jgi:hypothetical protein
MCHIAHPLVRIINTKEGKILSMKYSIVNNQKDQNPTSHSEKWGFVGRDIMLLSI